PGRGRRCRPDAARVDGTDARHQLHRRRVPGRGGRWHRPDQGMRDRRVRPRADPGDVRVLHDRQPREGRRARGGRRVPAGPSTGDLQRADEESRMTGKAVGGNVRRSLPTIAGFAGIAVALLVVAPSLLSAFRLSLLGQFVCFAIVAVGIGLAWGRGGMLTLGQGVYFGLGAYVMAMHMKLDDAGPGGVPDFMQLYGSGEVPW